MNALELSAILLTLSAAAFGWGAIIVGAGIAVAWVFGGMCKPNELDQPTAAHTASEGE